MAGCCHFNFHLSTVGLASLLAYHGMAPSNRLQSCCAGWPGCFWRRWCCRSKEGEGSWQGRAQYCAAECQPPAELTSLNRSSPFPRPAWSQAVIGQRTWILQAQAQAAPSPPEVSSKIKDTKGRPANMRDCEDELVNVQAVCAHCHWPSLARLVLKAGQVQALQQEKRQDKETLGLGPQQD